MLRSRLRNFSGLVAIASVLSSVAYVNAQGPLRVDINSEDGRQDTITKYWETWPIADGPKASRSFQNITVDFRSMKSGSPLRAFLDKAGIVTGATMATDGLIGYDGLIMEVAGLTPGPHTITTYHNSMDSTAPAELIVRCFSGEVPESGNAKSQTVKPSIKAANNADVAYAFFDVNVDAGKTVTIQIAAKDEAGNAPVVLNGFEIDGKDPASVAKKPMPAHGFRHADGDSGKVELQWQAASNAKQHDVYLAVDADAAKCAQRVASANRGSSEFMGTVDVAQTAVDVSNDSRLHYCWRVDEINSEGKKTIGDVWHFQVRHLAFPEAEGYGRHARGGRGGRVMEVTNLNDSGPGSLRAAVEASGPRTVVFNVSGLITLNSKLVFRKENSDLTVAGQTAPGKGICIRNWTFGGLGAEDVIIRHVRLRLGTLADTTMDGMGLASANHSIIDHCSISWTIDEAFSSRNASNITLQRCLISEALNAANHKKYGAKGRHSFAASIGGDIGSFHHNLLAHCAGRNWSLAGGVDQANRHKGRLDVRNNVVYNWNHRTTDGGAREVNFVNNYYKPGPASEMKAYLVPQFENPSFGPQQYYVEGNVLEGIAGPEGPTGELKGVQPKGQQDAPVTVSSPFFEHHVTTHSAKEAYENVLEDVGCNVPMLDDHDRRVIEEVRSGTAKFKGSVTGLPGIPDSQDDVGGWEDYPVVNRPANWDTDHDGIPNEWELSHGLDPSNSEDGAADANGDGYTNLEDYLNWLAAGSK